MMLRGLWKLTWIEIKIFLREPLGAIGTIVVPVLVFLVVGRIVGGRVAPAALAANNFIKVGLPVLTAILIVISAVLSLVTIISIYREGGILKRLRATPLRPQTIQALLPGRRARSVVLIHHRAADQYLEHPLDRLCDRQHRPHSAFCPAHRRHHHVPDDRFLGTLRAPGSAAASDAHCCPSAAALLRGGAATGNLERRRLVCTRR